MKSGRPLPPRLKGLIFILQDFIVDIDGIQAHGKISITTNLAQVLTQTRRGCSRHHQAQSEWLLHRCRTGPVSCPSGFADNKQSVHAATRKTLLKVKGFSEVKVEKIKEAILKCQVSDNRLEDVSECQISPPGL